MGGCNSAHSENDENAIQDKNSFVLCEIPKLLCCNEAMFSNDSGKVFSGEFNMKKVSILRVDQQQRVHSEKESEILRRLDHENVIQQMFQIEWEGNLFIVFEYHEVSLNRNNNNLINYRHFMSQLLAAIEYLQGLKIVLVNLNPSNIFVVEKNFKIKVTNFTRAIELKGNSMKMKGNLKTEFKDYAAPEVTKNRTVYLSSDVYSLGCVLFYMFSGGIQIKEIVFKSFENILKVNLNVASSYVDILCADLIQKLIPYKQSERLKIDKIRSHPFFWSPQTMMNFFIEVGKTAEAPVSRDLFRKALYNNSKAIVGENEDWTVKVDEEVLQELQNIRSDFIARSGTETEVKAKKNILSLIRVMRNIIVHAQTPAIAFCMGTPEKFVSYWFSRFPGLLLHVYNAQASSYDHQ